MLHYPLVRSLALVLLGLALTTGDARAQSLCSIQGRTSFTASVMREYYLWNHELPHLSPDRFTSPEAYLEAVRVPRDRFSRISSRAETEAFFGDSQFVGFGLSFQLIDGALRITQVYPDGPAAEAGLRRGATLQRLDGRTVSDLLATGQLGEALGPSEIGYEVDVAWTSVEGTEHAAVIAKRVVTIPTISPPRILHVDGRPVGYLHFRNFVEPSFEALDLAFASFHAADVDEVVLDLRYNGGGLISVAVHLAGLLGGSGTANQVLVRYRHNDLQRSLDRTIAFPDPELAVDARRVVFITSGSTASASELVINALRPFVEVTLVGDRTLGKPVGQYGFEFCDQVLFPVSFDSVNAVGEGEYYDGFAADCPMGDGLERELGDPAESRLAEALHVLEHGTCTAPAPSPPPPLIGGLRTGQRRTPAGPSWSPTGFRQLVNAW